MRAVIDTSSLISLAWAGQLELLPSVPLTVLVLDSVYQESVTDGLGHGHPDAAAIEHAIASMTRIEDPAGVSVDDRVVVAAASYGAVITNDQVIGRRARNLGARWVRTADLVILTVRSGFVDPSAGGAAIQSLHSAGRITDGMRDRYLEELA